MSEQRNRVEILIVGGGMVGAALALELVRAGREVAMVDMQAPRDFVPGSPYAQRVSAINRASQHNFAALGAWQGICTMRAHAYRSMEVWDAVGGGRVRFDAMDLGQPDLGHIIENSVVQRALWDRLESESGIQILCPDALASLDVTARGVHVVLASGRRLDAALVVGADGARSRVRELSGIALDSRRYGQKALVATVRTALPHQDTAWQRFLPTGPLAFLPLSDGSCSIVWSADDERANELHDLGDAEFCRALTEGLDQRLGDVLETSARGVFPLRGAQARHYVRPRIALVGDAAHTIHPLAGQGANLGFEDARALALALARQGSRDPGDLRVLRRYERTRRGENLLMMRSMEGFRYVFGSELAPLSSVRSLGLDAVDRLGFVKSMFMRQALGLSADSE